MPAIEALDARPAWQVWTLRGILACGLLIRLAYAWYVRHAPPAPDAVDDYIPIARHLLEGIGFLNGENQPDIVRGPVYPLFVAVAQLVSRDSLLPLLWMQAVTDTLTLWLLARLAGRMFGITAALCSAVAYAVNPLSIFACGLVVPEIVFTCLLMLAVERLLAALETSQITAAIASGVFLGAAVLCRSTPLLLVFPGVGALAWGMVRQRKNLVQATAFALACGMVILPWTVRNMMTFGEFIPVVANGGSNVYAGSERAFWAAPPAHHQLRLARQLQLIDAGWIGERPLHVGPSGGDKYNLHLGLANYRRQWQADPGDLFRFFGEKFCRLWYASQSGKQALAIGAVNLSLLFVAMWGSVLAWGKFSRQRLSLAVCLGTVAYFVVVLTALFPQARYVIGFTPLLSLLAGPALRAVLHPLEEFVVSRSTATGR